MTTTHKTIKTTAITADGIYAATIPAAPAIVGRLEVESDAAGKDWRWADGVDLIRAADVGGRPGYHLATAGPGGIGIGLTRTGGIRRGGWVAVDVTVGLAKFAGVHGGWFKPAPAAIHPADLSVRS